MRPRNTKAAVCPPAAVLVLLLVSADSPAADPKGFERWESSIAAFEKQDQENPPPKGGILFVGSSSIRGWDLDEYFPNLPVVNRGFGGSQVADSVHFADRIVLPHRPRIIVLYAGDNDVAAGKSPQQVFADYKRFVETVHAALPKTRIVFIAIKPSLKRWSLWEKMREANGLVEEKTRADKRLEFVDVAKPVLGSDGKPIPEIFKSDGLHLNAQGYKLWTSLLMPYLKSE